MSLRLTTKEIIEVTGRKVRRVQIEWFQQNGITVLEDANGKPLVYREHFFEVMGMKSKRASRRQFEPDFGALS